jgi:hypothetical protein
MPKLTENEIQEFLDEPGHLARIGTIDADGEDPRGVWAARYYLPGTKWAVSERADRGS